MSSTSPLLLETGRSASKVSEEIDRVRCVLYHDERYLLAQHNSRRSANRDKWSLPGGRVRPSEQPQACLRRELVEELCFRVRYLVELGDWSYRDETHRVYGCEIGRPLQAFDSDELRAIGWFTYAEVRELAAAQQLRRGYELAAIKRFRRQHSADRLSAAR